MRRKHWLLAAGAALLALLAAAYIARDPLATAITKLVLARDTELACTPVEVSVSASLDTLTFSPVSCSIRTGPVREFATQDPATISLRGLSPQTIRVARASMDQRDRDISHVQMNTLGELADLVGMTDELVKSLLDGSETYAPEGPALYIEVLTTTRLGKNKAVMKRFRSTIEEGWNRTQGTSADSFAGIKTVMRLDQRVTRSRATATVALSLGGPERGDKPDFTLRLSGEQLDTRSPQVKLSIR